MEPAADPDGLSGRSRRPEELSESECLRLLRDVAVGRLALRLETGGVDIFPINFAVDHGTLLFCTAAGLKVSSIEHDPVVAFEADHFDWYDRTAWSVVVKGEARLITDRHEVLGLLEHELDSWQDDRKPFYVRIVPTSITGRRFEVRATVTP